MKYIKTYENLLKGKSIERLKNDLKGKQLIEFLIKNNIFDELPRNEDGVCIYDGDYLDLYDCNLTSLPENLTVKGDLCCSYNKLTSLPDNLKVKYSLWCDNNELTCLPDNLTIKDFLDCSYNNLTQLPDNLTVGENLLCEHQASGIKLTLPQSAKIGRKFYN